jgi:thiamine biosynthesis lipoprotein
VSVWGFDAIGTRWEVETAQELPPDARDRVRALIDDFDREWSRFRDDSVVSHLGAAGGSVPAPADAVAMLDAYRQLDEATEGAVNPLVGVGLEALGYDAQVTLRPGQPAAAPADWQHRLSWSASRLSLDGPAVIDVGALGKGRLVDRLLAALDDVPERIVVDASGDLVVRGGGIRVALEHPNDATKAIGVVEVRDQALCASATNRRAWGSGLHHVLDARTGLPVHTWAATWAIAPDAMTADATATALFFAGGAELAGRWGAEWVRMSTDGRVERSPGFAGDLFTRG